MPLTLLSTELVHVEGSQVSENFACSEDLTGNPIPFCMETKPKPAQLFDLGHATTIRCQAHCFPFFSKMLFHLKGCEEVNSAHLKKFERCEKLPGLLVSPVDLEPFEIGLLVVVFHQRNVRTPDGSTQELGFPDL